MSTPISPIDELHTGDVTGIAGRKRLQKNATFTSMNGDRGAWMEEERKNIRAYEYLCHIGEAKEWIEACIDEDIGAITEMPELLRRGVILAKLARFFQPDCVRRIFEDPKLQYRHSDNTNFFFAACRESGLPEVFLFELTDIYDKKNTPKVIYCIHALSHYLAKRGVAPKIKNLVGQLEFTQEDIDNTENSLKEAGVALPQFGNVEGALAKELNEETEEEKRMRFLEEHCEDIIKVQAFTRGHLARVAYRKRLETDIPRIVKVQSLARRWLAQSRYRKRLALFKENEQFIVKLQASIRGYLLRRDFKSRKDAWARHLDQVIKLQAQFRRHLAQSSYQKTLNHYKDPDNLAKVVKLQAFLRGKLLGSAFQSLSGSGEVPVKSIQSFIHLLDNSDRDFDEELQLENLKQAVVKRIKENNQMEQLLNDLDIKIALLVRNRITLDEVVKMSRAKSKGTLADLDRQSNNSLGVSQDGLFSSTNLKSLDKDSRSRLELYQNLFYLLQTQPKYLAKAIFLIKQVKIRSFMDNILLTIFNFANSSREEYLLLKLFQEAIREEMKSVSDVGDFMRGNPVFIKMVVHYNRGAKDRQYLRDLLQPLVKEVIGDDQLDLETDPIAIYRQLIKAEESRTGEASKRPFDISREDALKDPETQTTFARNLVKVQEVTDKFLEAIIKQLPKMPYGIRFIAQQLRVELNKQFPSQNSEDEERIDKVVGNFVYYRYMNPAIVAPEGFDVIEQLISPLQRKNLAEISKMLQQIAVNRKFEGDQIHLSPMNDYVVKSADKMTSYFRRVTDIPSADDHFQMSNLYDFAKTSKPVIYISPQEIFNLHALLVETIDDIVKDENDILRRLLKEIPVPPIISVDYSGRKKESEVIETEASSKTNNEISLILSSRFADTMSSELFGAATAESITEYRNQFLEAKRYILSVIRIQGGKNLLDILERPCELRDEKQYEEFLSLERKKDLRRNASTEESQEQPKNDYPETFLALKEKSKAILEQLEFMYVKLSETQPDVAKQLQLGVVPVTKVNCYQDVLTSIGRDIRNKHRRRLQRRNEMKTLHKTLQNLNEKLTYLDAQKQSYQDYINSCMAQLTSNRKKGNSSGGSKFVMPFTPQWHHLQELKKQGKVPQFGSFKYGADVLFKKGVLVSVDGYSPKQYDKITLIISSDETGVFTIEVSILGVKMPQKMELKLEDLLQYQFDNQQVIPLFDGAAKVNVNLLIYLINKKFYR